MALTNSELLNIDKGILQKDAFVVIVRTEWNATIVNKLEEGCLKILHANEVTNYKIITVPGAFEILFGIKAFWNACQEGSEKPGVFIALGCVLRGGTPHFEYVCQAVTQGIVQLNLELPVPTIFGVLTLDTQEQADERTGGSHGHKGEEAAITALKMISLRNTFPANK